uniref:Phosphotransferase n=1 Tax=Dendroctonus ponderosae TaxID=77166 RepID=J3JWG4_DENPD|nr:unknown [Dendroctonus ponderosae]
MSCPSKICNPPAAGADDGWVEEKASPEIKEAMKPFALDEATLRKTMALFLDNIERGLKKATHDEATVKCFPTYVQDLPQGTEKGKFLALDLGGTNFRVLLVELDIGKCDLQSDIYAVPHDVMLGTGEQLFDHIAASLADFVTKHQLEAEVLPLGFTFSFPLVQKGLRSGLLVRWTKGFNIPEVLGGDVVQWLQEALERRGDIKIDVCAILNDTTGTLMSCAWKNPECRIGLIIGTGHNGCYLEAQANAELFDEPDMGSGKVIINLEAAAFGDDGCLEYMLTDVDKLVDGDSINPGKQIYEKLISGMYLGEVARLYVQRFIEGDLMFGGNHAEVFQTKEVFETAMISDVESDPAGSFQKTQEVLQKLGISDASEQDMINLRFICQSISRRSAHLTAATACVLTKKVNEPKIVIGIDGSVYKFHPHFRKLMKAKMQELMEPGFEFDLMLSEDGSGRGAALVAAMAAMRMKDQEA